MIGSWRAVIGVCLGGAILIGVAVIGANVATSLSEGGSPPALTCPIVDPVTVGRIVVPAGPIAGYCQDRLVNAAHIMNAARGLGIGTHTQAVGVMTAIGESGLRLLDHGDAVGTDSRGLFQQRDNGAWGTLADRMDPFISAQNFFTKLTTVSGWQTMSPTHLAHAVQANANPDHYAPFWPAAQTIVTALDGHQ